MSEVDCCIAGGGPAGMMLGLLLARQGLEVMVLEKHGDFLRDFRGDTVHPSTLRLLDELGLADEFLELPHQKVTQLGATTDDGTFVLADFSRVPGRFPFLAFVPQWDFLDFLADRCPALPELPAADERRRGRPAARGRAGDGGPLSVRRRRRVRGPCAR